MTTIYIDDIAKICHEANRALCEAANDYSQPTWYYAPGWQTDSAIAGVEFHIANPNAPAHAGHESWLKQKAEDGWAYGETKDVASKLHPCFVPFEELPTHQQLKDHLFKAIVNTITSWSPVKMEYRPIGEIA